MSGRDRRYLATALVLNPAIRWILLHRGTAAAAGFVQRCSERAFRRRERVVDDALIRAAKRGGAAVNRAATEPAPAVTCLARSFTALLLLRRDGVPAELRIGVRPRSADDLAVGTDPLLFHAWVEVGDVPVNDELDVAARHAVFPLDGLGAFLRRVRQAEA